jgi:hypothetical protein
MPSTIDRLMYLPEQPRSRRRADHSMLERFADPVVAVLVA